MQEVVLASVLLKVGGERVGHVRKRDGRAQLVAVNIHLVNSKMRIHG